MKRLAFFCIAAVAVTGLIISHSDSASANNGKKAEKVNLCHNVTSTSVIQKCHRMRKCKKGQIYARTLTVDSGKVINVNANAAQAHLNHGDFYAKSSLSAGDDCRRKRATPCRCMTVK